MTQSSKEKTMVTLKQIGADIKTHDIMSVDALAEFYKTNTVQLNRVFKNFNTTPGKFLKKIKLDMAREMLSKNMRLDEVVTKTGYSAAYLKKELPLKE